MCLFSRLFRGKKTPFSRLKSITWNFYSPYSRRNSNTDFSISDTYNLYFNTPECCRKLNMLKSESLQKAGNPSKKQLYSSSTTKKTADRLLTHAIFFYICCANSMHLFKDYRQNNENSTYRLRQNGPYDRKSGPRPGTRDCLHH